MLLWTIWWISVSLLLILLIHYLYIYLKNAVTIPIIDDTETRNKKRYDDMLAPVKENKKITNTPVETRKHDSVNESMKNELQSFLNDLKIESH